MASATDLLRRAFKMFVTRLRCVALALMRRRVRGQYGFKRVLIRSVASLSKTFDRDTGEPSRKREYVVAVS